MSCIPAQRLLVLLLSRWFHPVTHVPASVLLYAPTPEPAGRVTVRFSVGRTAGSVVMRIVARTDCHERGVVEGCRYGVCCVH